MKILLISDEESKYLWDHYQPGRLDGVDLIISCGDLSAEYLSFLVTMGRAPVLYVHGNHDDKYAYRAPDGCECIEDKVVNVGGIRILGLGGSMRYSKGKNQYTERQMSGRVRRARRLIKRNKGVDLIVTHSPVRGFGDDDTPVHRGFECFQTLLETCKPRYWAYGHVHMRYSGKQPRLIEHGETTLVNACERYMIEIEPQKQGEKANEKNAFGSMLRFCR